MLDAKSRIKPLEECKNDNSRTILQIKKGGRHFAGSEGKSPAKFLPRINDWCESIESIGSIGSIESIIIPVPVPVAAALRSL